ncbi:hypothetical protein C8R43DRAFT_837403, partial [Mycena crocata]
LLAEYESQLDRLQETVLGILSARSKLQDYVNDCRAAVSPVRRLPPEILCEIFIPLSQSPPQRRVSSLRRAMAGIVKPEPIELSKVCSHWRRIIVGTPQFWSDVALYFLEWRGERQSAFLLHLLKLSLDRGATHPLNLSVS